MIKQTILVTGGAGYIGSHTVVQLINEGYDVVIADDLSNSREEVLDSIQTITGVKPLFFKADLCDKTLVNELFSKFKIDAIIHFAAKKLVGESVEQPLMYYQTNLNSLMNIIEAAMQNNVLKFVFSSSCSVYGQPDTLPVTEDTPLMPAESPYGNTKKISEDILRDVSRVNPMHVVVLRYFNPVGAHPSGLIGEYPLNPPSNLMPVITQVAAGKRDSLSVFGTDYSTPDGTCIRDYIHVVDLANAHLASLQFAAQSKGDSSYETFNVGTGTGISVLQMIKTFEKVNGVSVNHKLVDRRPGDVEKVFGSTVKANKMLNWNAELGLEEMVSSAWKWEKSLSHTKSTI